MEKQINYTLKQGWDNIGLPSGMKEKILKKGAEINESVFWKIIDRLLTQSNEFQRFRRTKDFREVLNTGEKKEVNEFFNEIEKVNVNLRSLTSVLDEKLNEAIKK